MGEAERTGVGGAPSDLRRQRIGQIEQPGPVPVKVAREQRMVRRHLIVGMMGEGSRLPDRDGGDDLIGAQVDDREEIAVHAVGVAGPGE